jgi:polyhydroxybutyrate depolymerase
LEYGVSGVFIGILWDSYDSDDVGFIRELINKFQSEFNIDANRIYITGWSNGGMMAYRLGAELSDIIAAIAPVGGSIGGVWDYWEDEENHLPLYVIPEPENPLPVIVFHGMNDSSVPYGGIKNPETEDILLYSVNESVAFWVEHNNCDTNPQINVSESGNIIKKTYASGDDGSEVVLYTVVNGGHEWFGSSYFPSCEISCNDLMWDFFESHPKQ